MNAFVKIKDQPTEAAENATNGFSPSWASSRRLRRLNLDVSLGSCNSCGKTWMMKANAFSNKSPSLHPWANRP